MSAGHLKYEEKPVDEYLTIIGERDTAALAADNPVLNTSCDVPYVGGMSISGKTVYIDQLTYQAIMSGACSVRGMTAKQIVSAIVRHEHDEKSIMDGDNPVDTYPAAHEFATTGEHRFVENLGVNPEVYEEGLRPFINKALKRRIENPPRDLWCGPIIDEPDDNDRRIIRELRKCGVRDAFKRSKLDVRYGMGAKRCEDCAMMKQPSKTLSECDAVSGLIRNNRQCDLWERRK